MAFTLARTELAAKQYAELGKSDPKRQKKVKAALQKLAANPYTHSLQTHEYDDYVGPNGEKAFGAYIENNTPDAWRIVFCYTHGKRGDITIIAIIPHPK